ncbi:MAG: tetratricopeptide repeat protein [Deltaproteobacteria bacterium]|nr:MAG: tetratricopeptide repeat protein [Deltaproteobacteria bacterium]
MDTTSALLWASVGAGVLLLAAILLLWRRRRARRGPVNETQAYLKGVYYLLSDNPDAAIEELTRVVQVNTEAVDTYFALGALFRRKGEVDRAIRIHQNLLLRPGLPASARSQARYELALDYRKAGLLPQARKTLHELFEAAPPPRERLAEALALLRDIEMESGDCQAAVDAQKRRMRVIDGDERPILAHLLAAAARAELEAGRADEAKSMAKEALKHDPDSVDALLALGETLVRAGDPKGAERYFDAALERMPEAISLAWQALCDLFYSRGEFEAMSAWLRGKVHAFPQVPQLRLALAKHLRSRGLTDAALEELKVALDLDPGFHEARRELGRLLLEEDMSQELRAQFGAVLDAMGERSAFVCEVCGHGVERLRWRCPRCGAWDSFQRKGQEVERPPAEGVAPERLEGGGLPPGPGRVV